MSNPSPRVTVWNEYLHERQDGAIAAIYPEGIHNTLAAYLRGEGFTAGTATLDQPEHGLNEEVLAATDVLIWWGHQAHEQVKKHIVDRVHERIVRDGMGLIALHSAHFSQIFIRLMGTSCQLKWREADEKERLWVVAPSHPIAAGLGDYFEIPQTEMYGEHFDIPSPDTLVFVSWFQGGNVFRSGCCFHRGRGKIFYFRPGHETLPIYHHADVLRVIKNAVLWASPTFGQGPTYGHRPDPLERLGAERG